MENLYQQQISKRNFLKNLALRFRNRDYNLPRRRFMVALGITVLILVGSFLSRNFLDSSTSSVLGSSDQRISIPGAKATKIIGREFSFPLKDDKGVEISRVRYSIETAELRDQIIVKGQKASSVKGRTFLILNIKLLNEFTKAIEIKTSDYVRLSVNGNEAEWLAPDIHNDPVAVAAISTKFTRVGFPINDTDKNLKLRIGEIEGEKQIIDIDF